MISRYPEEAKSLATQNSLHGVVLGLHGSLTLKCGILRLLMLKCHILQLNVIA